MRGAVWDGDQLVVTTELEVRPPGPGEAQVRLLASGICHSDLNVMDGFQSPGPIVLGHEAAGVVAAVGPGVSSPVVGDAVMVGSPTPCRVCRACRAGRFTQCPAAFGRVEAPFVWKGAPVRSYANVSSFAELITVRADQLFSTAGLAPISAAVIGCAVSTGFGVARNVAQVVAGDAVVVIGVGGIGVNAVQTARLQGAAHVVAVDVNPAKEEVARRFGASSFVLVPPGTDGGGLIELIRSALPVPVDAVIECSGAPAAIFAAVGLPGPGGVAALVGIPSPGTEVAVDVNTLLRQGRRIVGSLNGEIDPFRDLPEIISLIGAGRLDLSSQITRTWALDDIHEAIAAVRAGEVVRAVVDYAA